MPIFSESTLDGANCLGGMVEQQSLLRFAPLVKRAVRQLLSQASAAVGKDDMEQIGLMGLLAAVRRYGPLDEGFPAYALMRVRGAILDELRRQDWRPRAVRQIAHRARDMERHLRRALGREPRADEVGNALGIGVDAYRDCVIASNAETMISFDEQVNTEFLGQEESPESKVVRRRALEQALDCLKLQDKRVIQLYYEYDLSLREIARVLNLTEARVCQIHKAALLRMRAALGGA